MSLNDTVAAISTPYGRGGIAVIRISGTDAIEIAAKVFRPFYSDTLENVPQSKAVYGEIVGRDGRIDDGLATVFHAPKSFTGENTVEISCHGGILLTKTILGELFREGAKQAGPGEFTKRAFINGKITLTQAEAVIDLIDAKTDESMKLAKAQSEGVLSHKIDEIASEMTDLLSEAYVTSDYPDEDLTDINDVDFLKRAIKIKKELFDLASTYRTGMAVREGIPTAIAGRPNTGKSSLLNALLGCDRAIVTDIPGTTRDTIEETASAGRITLLLSDTAGIRETDDTVENIGVERARKSIGNAELVLAVFDGSQPLTDDDRELIDFLKTLNKPILPIINKKDRDGFAIPEMPKEFLPLVCVSASAGEGIDTLKNTISQMYVDETIDYSETAVISNERQYAAVKSALDMLKAAISGLESGLTRDMAALDIENAHSCLCEADGRGTASEITDKIFHRFCVGK